MVERPAFDYEGNPHLTWQLHALKSFLIQSSYTLNKLSIRGLELSDEDHDAVFRQLPCLTSITIEGPPFDRESNCKGITPTLIQNLHILNPEQF